MLTTIDEEVLELWTRSVTSIPITSPAKGFDSTEFFWKISPAALPEKQKTHSLCITNNNEIALFKIIQLQPKRV